MTGIAFVTGSLAHGGAERHSIALVNRLAGRGHECHAVYVKEPADQLDRLRPGARGTIRCLGATRYLDARALTAFAAHLARVAPAVVVAANAYALLYASIALRLARRRSALVVTWHSTRLTCVKERLQMLAYRPLFWRSDCTVFVCETQRRYCMRRGVMSRRNVVIHNGVDTAWFHDQWSGAQRRGLRAGLGIAERDYVVGTLSVLRPEKNTVQLVEAIAALRGQGIPARGLVIGDGEMRAQVEARARDLGIARAIAITGLQADVRPFVAACDVVALCGRTEAFPLGALEAMAMARPVVHSEVGGASELIRAGRDGLLFPAGDTEALVHALRQLADGGLAAAMGCEARASAVARFSETAMVDRYESLLAGLGGSRRESGVAAA